MIALRFIAIMHCPLWGRQRRRTMAMPNTRSPPAPGHLSLVPAAMAALCVLAISSGAAADPAEGRRLARQWCVSCHALDGATASRGTDAAPSFMEIARRPDRADGDLRLWLSASHRNMPDFSLTQAEIADLIDFIRSLRAR